MAKNKIFLEIAGKEAIKDHLGKPKLGDVYGLKIIKVTKESVELALEKL